MCKFLGAQFNILGAQLQVFGPPTPKDQKNTLRSKNGDLDFLLQYGLPILACSL